MKKSLLIFSLLGFLLVGCSGSTAFPSATLTTVPSVTSTLVRVTPTILPTKTVSPTPVSFTPAVVNTLPPTATVKPTDSVALAQLRAVSSIPETSKIQGSIVLAKQWEIHSYYESDSRQITIWNLETNQQYNLLSGDDHVEDIIVSPDGRWLKYTKKKLSEADNWFYPTSLHIASVDGQEQKMIPWANEWNVISQWSDNKHLIIRRNVEGDDPYSSTFTAKWVLDPFTETLSELPKDPEDIFALYPKPGWSGIGMVSYNPDLAFRLYLSWNSHLILEDLNTHQVLDVLPNHYRNNTPCWSPSGQEFAVAATLEGIDEYNVPLHFDLYSVSVEGIVTRLTDLTDHFEYYSIKNCVWSPDAKKIAFWLDTTDPYPDVSTDRANLAVVDVDSHKVTIYSLESTDGAEQKIVWSPDGQRLLTGVVQPDYQDVSTVLVDLAEGWYAQIADHITPVGWMSGGE